MPTIADRIADGDLERAQAHAEQRVAEARRERDAARTALKASTAEVERLTTELHLVEGIAALSPRPPKWLAPAQPKAHRAILCTVLSDLHLDEVVKPAEIGGVNAYDREIATQRLERYFANVVKLARHYLAGVTYEGVVLALGGDMFSGDIHEELQQTNEDTILGSLLYWSELLAAGVDRLADEFGKVHVPVVVGNHGRRSRKPRAKLRVRDNFDWFLGMLLARQFSGDARVTFTVPESADCPFDVYRTRFLLTHGDQFRGGSGIAGVMSPIMRGDKRKRERAVAIDQPYDVLVMGHFHQLMFGQGIFVNGSLKGYDEYAYTSNFGYEPPQQALWVVTPENGVSWMAPVLVQDRKREGW